MGSCSDFVGSEMHRLLLHDIEEGLEVPRKDPGPCLPSGDPGPCDFNAFSFHSDLRFSDLRERAFKCVKANNLFRQDRFELPVWHMLNSILSSFAEEASFPRSSKRVHVRMTLAGPVGYGI